MLDGELLYTKILEVHLFAFAYDEYLQLKVVFVFRCISSTQGKHDREVISRGLHQLLSCELLQDI